MSPLTPEQHGALQRLLEQNIARLRAEIAAALNGADPRHGPGLAARLDEAGGSDDALADLQATLTIAGAERDLRELRASLAALARLNTAAAGICTACGEAIPYARLQAFPAAARCLACESRAEQGAAPPSL